MTEYKQYSLECQKCKNKKRCAECDILAEREKIVCDVINQYISSNGYCPSVNDIAKELGIQKSNTHTMLTRMANKGYITYGKGKHNIIKVL